MNTVPVRSIVDCDLCSRLPQWDNVDDLGAWRALALVVSLDADVGDIDELRICSECGTYYEYRRMVDDRNVMRFDVVTAYLSRITFDEALKLLDRAPAERETLSARAPDAVASLARDLTRAPNLHVKQYIVDCITDYYATRKHWNALESALLHSPDPAIRVVAASRMVWHRLADLDAGSQRMAASILGEGLSHDEEVATRPFAGSWRTKSVASLAFEVLTRGLKDFDIGPAVAAMVPILDQQYNSYWRDNTKGALIEWISTQVDRARSVLPDVQDIDSAEARDVAAHCRKVFATAK